MLKKKFNMFTLTHKELLKIDAWKLKHNHNYKAAIGGQFTYCFTPTGIGVIVKVKCDCGKEIDISSYKDW